MSGVYTISIVDERGIILFLGMAHVILSNQSINPSITKLVEAVIE